jgi:hypothetical protein
MVQFLPYERQKARFLPNKFVKTAALSTFVLPSKNFKSRANPIWTTRNAAANITSPVNQIFNQTLQVITTCPLVFFALQEASNCQNFW